MVSRRKHPGQLRLAITAVSLITLAMSNACTHQNHGDAPTLTLFAASSLTDAFQGLADAFKSANPKVKTRISFAGSQTLRLQIKQGAVADIFASANKKHVQDLVETGHVRSLQPFARNELALIVPMDNPSRIESLGDLVRAQRLVIGTENVPVGIYTRRMLQAANVDLGPEFSRVVLARVASHENNVRLIRAKVSLGDADAAIVYKSDLPSAKGVRHIPIPATHNIAATYSMGVLRTAREPRVADRWRAFVLSKAGRAILAQHGFKVD